MAPPAGAGRHILVVEDDADIREALAVTLESCGYQVGTACHGREALDQLRHGWRADLIVLDLMMPVMDGWQFRREQQRDPRLAVIPVVIVSADGSVQQKATAIGAEGYIKKPVDPMTLLKTVEGQLLPAADARKSSVAEINPHL
jgi:CheY-like chemotaxis protein